MYTNIPCWLGRTPFSLQPSNIITRCSLWPIRLTVRRNAAIVHHRVEQEMRLLPVAMIGAAAGEHSSCHQFLKQPSPGVVSRRMCFFLLEAASPPLVQENIMYQRFVFSIPCGGAWVQNQLISHIALRLTLTIV